MTRFAVGQSTITRVEETYGRDVPPGRYLSGMERCDAGRARPLARAASLRRRQRLLKISVHSWLLQIGGQNILIDTCCGNHKSKPARPFWNMLDLPYLDRLAAAGARADEIDLVMCTHLHHDHVGWTTQLRDGRWVPTFPNARYVFSKPDFDYFQRLGRRSRASCRRSPAPSANAWSRSSRPGAPISSPVRTASTSISRSCRRRAIPPATSCSSSRARGAGALFIGDVFHHLLQVYYTHWNFPKNSDAEQARTSRRMVLDLCASTGALVLPGHVGAPFAGRIEATGKGFTPRF